MPIKYSLRENNLAGAPAGTYIARIKNAPSAGEKKIVDLMVKRGSVTSRAVIGAVFEEAKEAVYELLITGHCVTTDLVRVQPTIRGVFDTIGERYQQGRHQFGFRASPGPLMRRAAAEARLEKVHGRVVEPELDQFEDTASGQVDTLLTPGSAGVVRGVNLKIYAKTKECGVFFVDQNRKEEIPAGQLLQNHPTTLTFMIPELEPGVYRLLVRTTSRNATRVRSGYLGAVLTVSG